MEEQKMKKSERKRRRKRARALKDLAIQWGTMTFMAVLVFIGVFHVDKFQVKRVIWPLVDCAMISDDINYYRDIEYTESGYTDTTPASNAIMRLMEERRTKYYNSQDPVVSFVTTQFSLVKFVFLILALGIVVAVTAFPIIFLWEVYRYYWRDFKRRWRRINEQKPKPKQEEAEAETELKIVEFKDYQDEYYDYAEGVENIE